MDSTIKQAGGLIDQAKHVLIIQAENPDGDSLASALALEAILEDSGKQVTLYCSTQIPKHLSYLDGWDRVVNELPDQFDLSIIVDCARVSLLEKTFAEPNSNTIKNRPLIIFDHHETGSDIPTETVDVISDTAVATGELIFEIALQLNWNLTAEIANLLAASIMSDSLGLSTTSTTSRSVEVLAELVKAGADLAETANQRRQLMSKSAELTAYKGQLLNRIEYLLDGRIAYVTIPWEEIEEYSDKYNPTMLVIDDMKLVEGVELAVGFKVYQDGKITAKLRSNNGFPYCVKVAEHFAGGGHQYAAGFKLKDQQLSQVIDELVEVYQKVSS